VTDDFQCKMFLLEIATDVAELLQIEQARPFLQKQCEAFFRRADDFRKQPVLQRLRLERQARGAYHICRHLGASPDIYRVYYPFGIKSSFLVKGAPAGIYIYRVCYPFGIKSSFLVKKLPAVTDQDPAAMFPYGLARRPQPRDDGETLLRDCVRLTIIHDMERRNDRPVYFFRAGQEGKDSRTSMNQSPDEFAEWVYRNLVAIMAGWRLCRDQERGQLQIQRFDVAVRESLSHVRKVIESQREPPSPEGYQFGPGYRSVSWYGEIYTFTATQAAIVGILAEAYEAKTPDVDAEMLVGEGAFSQEAIKTKRGKASAAHRVRDLFRNNPAWGTMIVPGGTRGTYQLKDP